NVFIRSRGFSPAMNWCAISETFHRRTRALSHGTTPARRTPARISGVKPSLVSARYSWRCSMTSADVRSDGRTSTRRNRCTLSCSSRIERAIIRWWKPALLKGDSRCCSTSSKMRMPRCSISFLSDLIFKDSGRYGFASDNTAAICPEAWAALQEANAKSAPSYGEDCWTARVSDRIREIFETDCDVYFVFNGTAANALSLAQLCQSFHSIICHE